MDEMTSQELNKYLEAIAKLIRTQAKTADASGQIVRNTAQNRLQIVFDSIPDPELRAALKANGFRWSPKNQAWQRQLTDNALRAANSALGI